MANIINHKSGAVSKDGGRTFSYRDRTMPDFYETSREMLWHCVGLIEEFCKKDDLQNHTRKELTGLVQSLYCLMLNQLTESEQ